jgi:hypothetical protein
VTAPDGDLVVVGTFYGGQPTTTPMFIEKVDPDLNLRWRRLFGGSPVYNRFDVPAPAVLADGTIVFAANGAAFRFDASAPPFNPPFDPKTVLVQVSPAGEYRWIKTHPQPDSSASVDQTKVVANPGGGITVAGSSHGRVNLDFDAVAPWVGSDNDVTNTVFVAQYDADGKLAWAQTYPSAEGASLLSTADAHSFLGVAPDGAIYLAGGYDGMGAFGTTNVSYPIVATQFLVRMDATGSLTAPGAWVRNPAGGVLMWTLGTDGSLFQAAIEGFSRVDPATGQLLWSFATPVGQQFIHLTKGEDLVAVGSFGKPVDFDFGPAELLVQPRGPSSLPDNTPFLAAYDASGQLRWLRRPNVFTNNAVTIGRDGALYYINIVMQSATDFDPGPALDVKERSTTTTCYITKYAPL